MTGIFGSVGLGADPSAVMSLMPQTASPLAMVLQSSLRDRGYSKLSTDGKWGQCSQSAYKSTFGNIPANDRQNVEALTMLSAFGIDVTSVPMWAAEPVGQQACTNGSDELDPSKINPNAVPAYIKLGEMLGFSRDDICKKVAGQNSSFNSNTGDCSTGSPLKKLTKAGPSSLMQTIKARTTPQYMIRAKASPIAVKLVGEAPSTSSFFANIAQTGVSPIGFRVIGGGSSSGAGSGSGSGAGAGAALTGVGTLLFGAALFAIVGGGAWYAYKKYKK